MTTWPTTKPSAPGSTTSTSGCPTASGPWRGAGTTMDGVAALLATIVYLATVEHEITG